MSEQNKAVVRRYREVYNSRDLDRLGEVLSARQQAPTDHW